MIEEGTEFDVEEVIVLNKFEGNLTEEEMEAAQPIETVKVKNGKIIEHIVWKEETN